MSMHHIIRGLARQGTRQEFVRRATRSSGLEKLNGWVAGGRCSMAVEEVHCMAFVYPFGRLCRQSYVMEHRGAGAGYLETVVCVYVERDSLKEEEGNIGHRLGFTMYMD